MSPVSSSTTWFTGKTSGWPSTTTASRPISARARWCWHTASDSSSSHVSMRSNLQLLTWADGEVEDLGGVHDAPPGGLADLLAAAEPVGDEQRLGWRRSHGREHRPLRDLDRHVVVVA